MSTSDALESLRRENPRARDGFAQSVEAAAGAVSSRIATASRQHVRRARPRLLGAGAIAVAAAVAIGIGVGSPGGGPGVEDATAAVERAATATAASAERSGTAVVRITQGGELWAEKTVSWHGDDIAMADEARGKPRGLRVVDGVLYGQDPEGWLMLGDPASIDPGSGTTPAEYLAAVREDVGGATLRRLTAGMRGLTSTSLADGSTVYRGAVPAATIARETGFKEGQAIRVLPFGYVAHDEATNPQALDVALMVSASGTIGEIAVSWSPAWRYTVTYSGLGSTPAPVAPANARPFPDRRMRR